MRLLVDECLPGVVVAALEADGHDVVSAAQTAPGERDPDVLARSVSEGRVLVTADRGFGDLVLRRRLPSIGVVVLVLGESDLRHVARACAERLAGLGESQLLGRLTILAPDRTRQRALPSAGDRD